MKRHFVLLCTVALLVSTLSPVASASNKKEVDTEDHLVQEERAARYDTFFSVDSIFYEDSNAIENALLNKAGAETTPFSVRNEVLYYQDIQVSSYVGNSEILFFFAGDTLYRYHVASDITDIVLENPDIIWFYPLTSYNILFATAPATTSARNVGTATCSKIVPAGQVFSYDMLTKCTEVAEDPMLDISMTGMSTSYNIFTTTAMSINGKSIPHPDYPIGSVYSGSFEGGTQCHGFALFIYNYIWGSTSHGTRDGRTALTSTAVAKSKLKGISPGTLIRVDDTGSLMHTMIVEQTSETGITVYHANWTGGKVCETFFSYEDFANRWSEISYMQIPDCRYSAWSQFNSTNHVRTCLDCGKKEYRAHYAQTTGYGTCLACGYVGNIYVGIQTVPTEKQ